MKNSKGVAMAQDGNLKRIAVTYDEINDQGKVINPNVKVNRVITDAEVLASVDAVFDFAEEIIEEG